MEFYSQSEFNKTFKLLNTATVPLYHVISSKWKFRTKKAKKYVISTIKPEPKQNKACSHKGMSTTAYVLNSKTPYLAGCRATVVCDSSVVQLLSVSGDSSGHGARGNRAFCRELPREHRGYKDLKSGLKSESVSLLKTFHHHSLNAYRWIRKCPKLRINTLSWETGWGDWMQKPDFCIQSVFKVVHQISFYVFWSSC